MSEGLVGFLNLHKPFGWTSHDCVARLRRVLNMRKIGHSGTLDPMATGVLPIAIGQATRLLPYLPQGKAYRAVVRFGVETSTDDLEGSITVETPAAHLTEGTITAALPTFLGEIDQIPPMYSAIQVDGKRLYDLARRGQAVDVQPRRVVIHQLTAYRWQPGPQPELTLDIHCGPGTYIRAIARDLGRAVGTGATLAALTRTCSNGFTLEHSQTLEQVADAQANGTLSLVAPGQAVEHMDAIALPGSLARRWCLGQKLSWDQVAASATGHDELSLDTGSSAQLPLAVRILSEEQHAFLGIGEIRQCQYIADPPPVDQPSSDQASLDLLLAPKRVFASA